MSNSLLQRHNHFMTLMLEHLFVAVENENYENANLFVV